MTTVAQPSGSAQAPAAKPRPLPPHESIAQKTFMSQFGPALTEHVARACPPYYTSPADTPWAPLSLLEHRKPLGAQGFVAQAAANAIRGQRPYKDQPGRRRRRGIMYVAQVGTGKTYMGLVTALMGDEQVTGMRTPADQRPEKANFFPLIVLCPPIMVRKWAREAAITVPGSKVAIIDKVSTKEDMQELRQFDPTYKGGPLSALGCTERIARRIHAELAAWRKACQVARQNKCPLPRKPAHIVVISQNTAKLGSAWRPVYQMRYLREVVPGKEPGSERSVRFVKDRVSGDPVQVPCCPTCGQPLQQQEGKGRRTQRRGAGEDENDQALGYLSEQDLLGKPSKRVKRWCENTVMRQVRSADGTWRNAPRRCGAPLWEVIPSTQAPELQPKGQPWERSLPKALPLPGKTLRARRVDHRSFGADGWEWFQPEGDEAHPLCVKSTANRRLPVADYILRHWKGLFQTVIVDEAHQYSGAGTAQGFAAASLVDATSTAIGLTGTLFGGYSSTLFPMLWRLIPELRQVFGYKDLQRWIDLYGVRQKTYRRKEGSRREDGAASKRRDDGNDVKELPGISPLVLAHILNCCFFLEIPDVVKDLPPYKEEVITVPLGPGLHDEYKRFENQVTNALRQLLILGDHAALSSWFQGLMVQPSAPWLNVRVVHPHTHYVLGGSVPLPEQQTYPKEAALLDNIRLERAQGRRTIVYVEHTGEYDLLPRLKRLIEDDDARWATEDGSCPARPAHLKPVQVKLLRSTTVQTADREEWLRKAVEEGCDILICNAALVEVGLDLIAFATILVYEVIFNTNRWRQAIGRCHRPGQKLPVRVVQLNYEKAMEARGLILIAQKVAASMMAEGKLPGGESFTTKTLGKGAGNPILELAQSVIADADGQRSIEGSLEEAFREMLSVEQEQDELIGGEAIAAALEARITDESASLEGEAAVAQTVVAGRQDASADVTPETEPDQADVLHELSPAAQKQEASPDVAHPRAGEHQPAGEKTHQAAPHKKHRRRKGKHGGQSKTARPEQEQRSLLPEELPKPIPATASEPLSLWGIEWENSAAEQPGRTLIEPEIVIALPNGQSGKTPLALPPSNGGREALDEMLRQIEEAVATASLLLGDDEKCVKCGAVVEMFTPDGKPYCAPCFQSLRQGDEQTQEGLLVLATLSQPARDEQASEAVTAAPEAWPEQGSASLTPEGQIVLALQYLAGVCDGAARRDGHGFNKYHAEFGHDLARQSKLRSLSPRQLRRAATKLLPTYRRQLKEAGITFPSIGELDRWLTGKAATVHLVAQSIGTFRLDGEQVHISFHQGDPGKVAAIKAIRDCFGEGTFVPGKPPCWVLPITALDAVMEQFPDLESVA